MKIKFFPLIATALLISACGGGSSESSTSREATQCITVNNNANGILQSTVTNSCDFSVNALVARGSNEDNNLLVPANSTIGFRGVGFNFACRAPSIVAFEGEGDDAPARCS